MPEKLRDHRALNAALTGITAAVVGVILNLSVWFGMHVLFAETQVVGWLDAPVWEHAGLVGGGACRWGVAADSPQGRDDLYAGDLRGRRRGFESYIIYGVTLGEIGQRRQTLIWNKNEYTNEPVFRVG